MNQKELTLKSGIKIPALGLGTWQSKGNKAKKAVLHALQTGYRHIDTADAYGNHKEVGEALKESSLKREEIFLTTKIWRKDLKEEKIKRSAERFLEELQIDYIDLLLIHWPHKKIPVEESLGAFKELKEAGIIKSIGVSNFTISHLKEAMEKSDAVIDVNQVEFHPSLNQKDLKNFCDENEIKITAYSPLARGKDMKLKEVKEVAEKHGAHPAQILIKWVIQNGMIAIPKSSDPDHIDSNFESLNIELDDEDMEKLNNINPSDNRVVNPFFADL